MTAALLKEEYKRVTPELEFGDKNSKAYRNMMMEADLLMSKVSGGPTWISQTFGEKTMPVLPLEDRSADTIEMIPTKGGAYEGSKALQWTDNDSYSAW